MTQNKEVQCAQMLRRLEWLTFACRAVSDVEQGATCVLLTPTNCATQFININYNYTNSNPHKNNESNIN